MSRFSLDANILVYAADRDAGAKHEASARLLRIAPFVDCPLTLQVIGEFMNVGRRLNQLAAAEVQAAAERLMALHQTLATSAPDLLRAFRIAERYRLQFWDSLIISVCVANGVEMLISEDMRDGLRIENLEIVDPFNPANRGRLESLLRPG